MSLFKQCSSRAGSSDTLVAEGGDTPLIFRVEVKAQDPR